MKVYELIEVLKTVNPNAKLFLDINGGSIYQLDLEETEEQNDPWELESCESYRLVGYK